MFDFDFVNLKEFILALGKDGLKAAYSAIELFAFWLCLSLLAVMVSIYIVLRLKKKELLPHFLKIALGIAIGFSVTLVSIMLLFMIGRLSVKDEIDANYFIMLGFLLTSLVYAICLLIFYFANKKALKLINIIGVSILAVYFITMLFVISPAEENYIKPLSNTTFYIVSLLITLVIFLACIVFGKKEANYSTKSIAYASLCIALSFALSYVKIPVLAQGGSITLASALPLIIYCYIFGSKKGLMACVVYGILQCLQNPSIYHPLQVLLDYPIAFGAIALSGIFANSKKLNATQKFVIGSSLGLFGRYIAHVLSGYFVFYGWAPEGMNPLVYSILGNAYVLIDLIIVLLVGVFIFSSKSFKNEINKIN